MRRATLEAGIRTARKDGREVVTLRFAETDESWVVECDVYPLDGLRVEPLRPGPYRFATAGEVAAFVEETALALTYLGCDVT